MNWYDRLEKKFACAEPALSGHITSDMAWYTGTADPTVVQVSLSINSCLKWRLKLRLHILDTCIGNCCRRKQHLDLSLRWHSEVLSFLWGEMSSVILAMRQDNIYKMRKMVGDVTKGESPSQLGVRCGGGGTEHCGGGGTNSKFWMKLKNSSMKYCLCSRSISN